MEFPEYMDYFTVSYSPEFVEILSSIESSFNAINYTRHIDVITNIFQLEGTDLLRNLCDQAVISYRTHIFDALFKQGITLANVEEDKINTLSKILQGTVILAKTKLEDILNGELIEPEDDHEWFLSILSITSNLPITDLLSSIDKIDPLVIDYLKEQETIEDYEVISSDISKKRFMRILGDNKTGVVVNVIKNINYFNYNPDTILKSIISELESISSDNEFMREIRLLIAGSSLRTKEEIKLWAEEAVDQIKHDPKKALSINAKWENFEDLAL